MSRKLLIIIFGATCWMAGCSGESADNQAPVVEPAASSSALSAAPPTVQPSPAISVPDVAGKTPSEVAAVLGLSSSQETIRNQGRPYTKRYYRDGDIEIVYVDGKADWITIFGHGQLPFGPDVLPALGLPATEPTFANPNGVYRWETIPGIRELSVFLGQDGRAHYAYVLVNTKP
jgi:hypothetical protein